MTKCRMPYIALVLCIVCLCGDGVVAKTWRLKGGEKWESVAGDPQEEYLHALAEIKRLARAGASKEAEKALKQLKEDFPEQVGPDLELFVQGETHFWNDRYAKALAKYEKLLKDFPGSEFAEMAIKREYEIGQAYLNGRKKSVLGVLKLSGYTEGVEIMERVTDRAGLDEPNSIGLEAAVAVAEHYEQRERYLEAYLKWSEIASYWETGPVGKKAIYRMAEDNFAAYNLVPAKKRSYFDASKLTTAKTYYERFTALYPEEAGQRGLPDKLKQIDEQMSLKQLTIAQYYQRTGKRQAARLYFDMVVQGWPDTEAARIARQALKEDFDAEEAGGQ